jgi:GNAT superfamily N-acetyltransferase
MPFVIRPAVPADRAALVRMVKELNVHQGDPTEHFTEAIVGRDVFGPDAYLDVLVAERDGELVGYTFAHDGYESGYAARGIYLCDLYVAPHARREKIGRALVAAVARRAQVRGRTFLWWASRDWNTDAQKFYDTLGVINEPVMAHALTFEAFDALAGEGVAIDHSPVVPAQAGTHNP